MNQKKRSINLKRTDAQKLLSQLNGMISRKGGRGWVNWLLKVNSVILGGNTSALARSAVVCVRLFYSLVKSKGRKGLVLYTKTATVLMMQAIGGHRLHNSHQLGMGVARDRSGLPRVIPRQHRIAIRAGDTRLIRIWLSWFSIYRVISFPGKLKLSTITEPGIKISDSLWREILIAITSFCTQVLKVKGMATARLPDPKFMPLSKTSPSILTGKDRVSWSTSGIWCGAVALMQSEVYPSFLFILNNFVPSGSTLSKVWDQMAKAVSPELAESHSLVKQIGKLGLKEEAAGKVRVFAMVECWTQWILGPLHDYMFSKLALLPTDGTFDQLAPVDRLIENGFTRFWCYDLSAATDRLPVDVQASILNWLFGASFGWAWKHLLVGRPYFLSNSAKKFEGGIAGKPLCYAVGQPMGALSSWAMLAITHHFIVHWAAFRVGKPWGSFWDYAVLGDDIVIANGEVAAQYLRLMTLLGVGIGLHKSLISRKGVLEFAKRYYVKGVDCSPVPFKEMVAALINFEMSTEFIRKYELGMKSIAGFLGLGYRVRGHLSATFEKINKKLATIGRWRVSPWGTHPHNVQSWLNIQSWIIDPKWLIDPDSIWPESGPEVSAVWKRMVAKESARLARIRDLFPTRGTYGGNKQLMNWMENTLYEKAKLHTAKAGAAGPFYNVLFFIQQEYWEREIPTQKRDLSKYENQLFKWKTGDLVPDWKLLEWVDSRTKYSCVHGPRTLGEKITQRSNPTVLFPTRLHSCLVKKEGSKK